MPKKEKFWRMKIGNFLGKDQIGEIFRENRGKSETGGENASLPQGDGRPCL